NGYFTNWNNKGAPGFSAADNNFAYGPVYRVQSLSDRVKAILSKRKATPVDIVNAMEDGGSVDLDGAQLIGPVTSVLKDVKLTTAEQQVLGILQTWSQDKIWGPACPGRTGAIAAAAAATNRATRWRSWTSSIRAWPMPCLTHGCHRAPTAAMKTASLSWPASCP